MMNKDLSAAAAFELYQVGLIDLSELDQLVTETIEVSGRRQSFSTRHEVWINGRLRDCGFLWTSIN